MTLLTTLLWLIRTWFRQPAQPLSVSSQQDEPENIIVDATPTIIEPEKIFPDETEVKPVPEIITDEKKSVPLPEITIDTSWMIPAELGQAISTDGWRYSNKKPTSVTWHWTATWDRALCDRLLGGKNSENKPKYNKEKQSWQGGSSAHYCVGRTFKEGISQYVSLEHRSWHAGANQTIRWDGKKVSTGGQFLSGSRVSIGVETVNVGFERKNIPKQSDWIEVFTIDGLTKTFIQPWTEEQIIMMIFVGKQILEKYPHITPKDHHGHMDICPGYKQDPALAFPFAKVLSGIYDTEIEDVWSPFLSIEPRQKALLMLGFNIGSADGIWGKKSSAALKQFQQQNDLEDNGCWSTFVCWKVAEKLKEKGISLQSLL